MQLFYAPDITSEKSYILPEEESSHCIAVLRYKVGQNITITDGKGSFYQAVIEGITKKRVSVEIIQVQHVAANQSHRLHIAIAPTKNIERFEWFLEKATEIGINTITPLITDNSERRIIRTDRLEKIMIAAMKQSVKAYLPGLNPLIYFKDFIQEDNQSQLLIAHCSDSPRLPLARAYTPGNDVVIMIGPEGDFSPQEVAHAEENGYTSVSLGESRLRTETAGIVACHTIDLLNQDRK